MRLLDDQVGCVLDAMEATGRAEDTIVVFTSDHGDMTASHVDLMPTLAGLAGQPAPAGIDGRGLLRDSNPEYAFCERVPPNRERTRGGKGPAPASRMIRGGGWKYIAYGDGAEFL